MITRDSLRGLSLSMALLFSGSLCATGYVLKKDSASIIGQRMTVTAAYEDTLSDIARRYDLGFEEIRLANPLLDVWLPQEGSPLVLPTHFILPAAAREGLVLNIPEMRLYYFPAGQQDTVITHPLGIGRAGWETPYIQTHIIEKKAFPNWYPPASIREEYAQAGRPLPRVVLAGSDNPLGNYAMRLGQPEYLIHGTNQPWGVGMRVSHGCLRLYPEDIESLFQQIPLKTKVNIVDQPYKIAARAGLIYIEVHPPLRDGMDALQIFLRTMDSTITHRPYWLDHAAFIKALYQPTGYPEVIGFYHH